MATYSVQPANYVVIAEAIDSNCKDLIEGRISQAAWKANQNTLWAEAAKLHVMADVMRIVCPYSLNK